MYLTAMKVIFLGFINLTEASQLKFVGPYDQEFLNQINSIVDQIDDCLEGVWKSDKTLLVAPPLSPSALPSYLYHKYLGQRNVFLDHILFLNHQDGNLSGVVGHEYSHFIFDSYMRQHQPLWKHYLLWERMSSPDFRGTISSHRDRKQQALLILKKSPSENSSKISQIERDIFEIQEILEIEAEIGADKIYKNGMTHIYEELLLPYSELFSDLVPVLCSGDFDIVSEGLRDLARRGLQLPSSNVNLIEWYFEQRSLPLELDTESYKFHELSDSQVYTWFPLVRSYVRRVYESGVSSDRIIRGLLEVLNVISLQEVTDADYNSSSLANKNRVIIKELQKKIEI